MDYRQYIWHQWKYGWVIIAHSIKFGFFAYIFLTPFTITDYLLKNIFEVSIVDPEIISSTIGIIIFPIALFWAGKITKIFRSGIVVDYNPSKRIPSAEDGQK